MNEFTSFRSREKKMKKEKGIFDNAFVEQRARIKGYIQSF